MFLCNCHSLTILLFFSYRFEGNKGLVSVRLTLLLKLWHIEPRTYIYLQRALESDFVPLNERNKLNYLIAKVNHVFFVYTLFMFIYSRDGNSGENLTPRGIRESRNGDLTFLGDRGR